MHFRKIIIVLSLLLCACTSDKAKQISEEPQIKKVFSEKKILLIGVANQASYEVVEPLVKLLNQKLLNIQLRLVTSFNFEDFEKKIEVSEFDMFFMNGLFAVNAEKNGYKIIAKLADDSSYCSAIIVKKGSRIEKITDLKGKKIAIAGKHSVLGEMAPFVFLNEKGLNVKEDLQRVYIPSFESCILNVYLGKCDVAAVWDANLRSYLSAHPNVEKAVTVKWKTTTYPNNAFSIKSSMPDNIAKTILNELLNLHKTPEGRETLTHLNITSVEAANAASFQKLLKLKEQFDKLDIEQG